MAKGSSSHLSLAVVACDHSVERELESLLVELRRKAGLPNVRYRGRPAPPPDEFHFSGVPEHICREFMAAIAPVAFQAVVVTVNKRALSQPSEMGSGNDLIARLITDCVTQLPQSAVENAVMIVDGGRDTAKLCDEVKLVLRRRMQELRWDYRLDKVVPRKSHRSPVIMVADMLAGAVCQEAKGKGPQAPYLTVLKGKVSLSWIPAKKEKPIK
jgi:hypothetical protein